MQKSVVFFGSSPLSNIVLQKLIDAKVVAAVVTKEDKPTGRHLEMTPNVVKVLAEKNGIQIYTSPLAPLLNLGEGKERGEVLGLVAAYGKIIPQNVLDTFGGQIYNIHPSLLPKYRGASPLQSQILDGVTETGVTIIKIDAEMDHGPIVAQEKDVILPTDTWLTLGERLFSKGSELFTRVILNEVKDPGQSGSLPAGRQASAAPQDDEKATYTKKITRQDSFVPWEEFNNFLSTSSLVLSTKMRAYAQWPGVWTLMPDGKRLKLISLDPILVQIEGKTSQLWPIVV